MKARRVSIMLALLAISALTLFLITLLDAKAMAAVYDAPRFGTASTGADSLVDIALAGPTAAGPGFQDVSPSKETE